MILSQRCLTRKATFAGAPDSSSEGTEIEYFFWLLNSISSPPLDLSAESLDQQLHSAAPELDRQRYHIISRHLKQTSEERSSRAR